MTTAATIRQRVEDDIAQGRLSSGDRLPAARSLADELGVSPNTVAAAYKQLRARGVVLGRGRQGTVVAPQTRPAQSQVEVVGEGLIDALTGSPDPDLLPDLAPGLAAACTGSHVRYGDPLLDPHFEHVIRAWFADDGVDANHLTATSGAMDAIAKILSSNELRRGDRIGVEDPGHVPVHQLVRAAGLEPIAVPVDAEGVTPSGLGAALEIGLKALIVTPRAHNPTGAAFTQRRTKELDSILRKSTDLLLIQDDHAGEVSGAALRLLTPPGPRHATIRSLGKLLGPDLRISVTVGDQRTVEGVAMLVSNGPGWVSHLLQRAAAHLMDDQNVREQLVTTAQTYSSRRERLIAALHDGGVQAWGPSGLNVWIPVGDEQAAVSAAQRAGYAIRAAGRYRLSSPPAVRVTISMLDDDQIDELSRALIEHELGPRRAPAI